MQKTLMVGLNEKDMEAVVRTYNLHDFYYPTLFPLKETKRLDWKMLEAIAGLHIAADLVARGATINRKTREAISRIQGDIPKIAIAREMTEDELTEYDIAVAMASNDADLKALVETWANDTQVCWTGIASRIEWIALKQISLGKVTFTAQNNANVVSEYNVDYEIPAAQKVGVNTAYTGGIAGKPFTVDIPNAMSLAKSLHLNPKFLFMNVDSFNTFARQEEVYKRCATVAQNLMGTQDRPNLQKVNAYLADNKELFKGLQIRLIDQEITIEHKDGSRVSGNPFEDNVMLFSESDVLGKTYWKTPIDAKKTESPALKVMHGHTLIKKFSEEEPVMEVTQGITNAFPAWNLAGRSILMQIDQTSWTK